MGLPPHPEREYRYATIARMRAEGALFKDIAVVLGISRSRVKQLAYEMPSRVESVTAPRPQSSPKPDVVSLYHAEKARAMRKGVPVLNPPCRTEGAR